MSQFKSTGLRTTTRPLPGHADSYVMSPTSDMRDEPKQDILHSNRAQKKKRLRIWAIGAVITVVVLVAIIVGAVVGVQQANRYPDYSPLNYTLVDSYQGKDFFSNFQYFNDWDPAQGTVIYDNPIDAVNRNVTFASDSTAVMRVNWTEPNKAPMHSARIYSLKTYDSGLFLFDVKRTPFGCATWPAVWLSNPWNWPADGEIDVIEAVNQGLNGNQMTLHTAKGCTMKHSKRRQTGAALRADCLNSTASNAGCGVSSGSATFGPAFNAAGGGVYALELRGAGIRMWFFPRASVPADVAAAVSSGAGDVVAAGKPDPSTWGEALADFPSTHCDVGTHFRNQSLIANIDLCGQWAGSRAVFTEQNQCPGATCAEYVQNNPDAFGDAVWEFGAWKVFKADS